MKYVKIINSSIDAIYDSEMDGTVEAPDYITLGYKLIDGEWFLPPPPPPEPEPVPQSVSMAKAHVAMMNVTTQDGASNLLEDVEAYINNITDANQRAFTLIAWNKSPEVSREGDLVTTLATGLGLSDDDLDALFIAADAIKF